MERCLHHHLPDSLCLLRDHLQMASRVQLATLCSAHLSRLHYHPQPCTTPRVSSNKPGPSATSAPAMTSKSKKSSNPLPSKPRCSAPSNGTSIGSSQS